MKTLLIILIVIEGIKLIIMPFQWWLDRQNKNIYRDIAQLDKEIAEILKTKVK